MPTIEAFRGLRYNLGHVGSLSDVVCPPYDVISPELQNQLYKSTRHIRPPGAQPRRAR
jgi:hypothetical protein